MRLERSIPELQGVPSEALSSVFGQMRALPDVELHSVMVLRHGKVIAEFWQDPFRPEYKHTVYSCSKTFTALAVGLAIDQGLLDLRDRVVNLLPGYLPAPVWALSSGDFNLSHMRVEDLLTMRSGIVSDWGVRTRCTDWVKTYLSLPVVNTPGEVFDYDSMCSYLLSAIVQKVSGMKLLDFLKENLLEPMDIHEVDWEESPEGINTGGWGLRIRTEDFAKIGQLFLNKGSWNGQQLIGPDWLEKMSMPHVETKYDAYGYQMWACAESPGACRLDGILGQYVLIYPREDMVIAITEILVSGGWKHRVILQETLFPALSEHALPIGPAYDQLQEQLPRLVLPMPHGEPNSALSAQTLYRRPLSLRANAFGWDKVTLAPLDETCLELYFEHTDGSTTILEFGFGRWVRRGSTSLPPYSINPVQKCSGLHRPFIVAGAYAWTRPDTLVLEAHWVDWVSGLKFIFHVEGENVQLEVVENYTHPQTVLHLKGKSAAGTLG